MPRPLIAALAAAALVFSGLVAGAAPAQAAVQGIHGYIGRDSSASRTDLVAVLYRIDGGTDVQVDTVGADPTTGYYQFLGLTPGLTYTMYYYDSSAGNGYAPEFWSNAPARSLASGIVYESGGSYTADVTLALGATVTGHIVEGESQLPSNAAYVVLRYMPVVGGTTYAIGRNAYTDALGNFTITKVYPGNYELEITKSGYSTEYWNDWSIENRADPYPAPGGGGTGPTANIWLRSAPASSTFFQDVSVGAGFYAEIDWMGRTSLSTGTPVTYQRPLYKPVDAVSRQAMASFLYRMSVPAGTYTPPATATFDDVTPSHPFYAAIEWMYANGISTGTANPGGKPLYKPNDAVSRQAMALFLFRLADPSGYSPTGQRFADVPTGSNYYIATAWMYDNNISQGTAQPSGLPLYKPTDPVSRQAMAAFLYRYSA